MIPSPIRKALSTIRKHRVDHLLMGGQACVLYGAAEFSRDLDLALLPDPANLDLLSLPDLIAAKKTQRDKDWPMIRRLIEDTRMRPTGDRSGKSSRSFASNRGCGDSSHAHPR